MRNIAKNRYLDALLKLMLLSAVIHMTVLAVYFVLYLDLSRFNFFKIVALDLFYPQLVTTHLTNIYSLGTMFILWAMFFSANK